MTVSRPDPDPLAAAAADAAAAFRALSQSWADFAAVDGFPILTGMTEDPARNRIVLLYADVPAGSSYAWDTTPLGWPDRTQDAAAPEPGPYRTIAYVDRREGIES